MRDAARGNSKRESIRDSLRRRGELTTTQSAFSKIKREYLPMVMRRGDSSEGERLLAFEFHDSVSPQFLL